VSVLRNRLVLMAAVAVVATACTEKLDSGSACPALCPVEQLGIQDTTIEGVAFDTTVGQFPPIGAESQIPLVTRTDGALDVRAALRFDTLPYTYTSKAAHATGNTIDTIAFVDSSSLVFRVDTTLGRLGDSVAFGAYDIDTTDVVDTATVSLATLFRDDRLLGTAKFSRATLGDTAALKIPLDDSKILAKVVAQGRLRVGVRVLGSNNITIGLRASNGGSGAYLSFRPSRIATGPTLEDSTSVVTQGLRSKTPADDEPLAADLADFALVVRGSPPVPVEELAVGGLPSKRGYLRFDIPQRLLDSTQIVRATLRLTQLPSPTALPDDSMSIAFWMGTATALVKDYVLLAQLHESVVQASDGTAIYGVANIRPKQFATGESAPRSIEVAGLLRAWYRVATTDRPHALILQSFAEGTRPLELRFASREAAAALRPTLQITYVPRATAGVP
jgi:hypothetical protein